MKKVIFLLALLPSISYALEPQRIPVMKEDTDGVLAEDEYRVISKDGSLTRRPCPYTCEMRGIPREHCKESKGKKDENECYVKDTRFPETSVLN